MRSLADAGFEKHVAVLGNSLFTVFQRTVSSSPSPQLVCVWCTKKAPYLKQHLQTLRLVWPPDPRTHTRTPPRPTTDPILPFGPGVLRDGFQHGRRSVLRRVRALVLNEQRPRQTGAEPSSIQFHASPHPHNLRRHRLSSSVSSSSSSRQRGPGCGSTNRSEHSSPP